MCVPGEPMQSQDGGYNNEPEPIHEPQYSSTTAPTVHSPLSKRTDPFDNDIIDDVPSIHSETDSKPDVHGDQLSPEVDILKIPSDVSDYDHSAPYSADNYYEGGCRGL